VNPKKVINDAMVVIRGFVIGNRRIALYLAIVLLVTFVALSFSLTISWRTVIFVFVLLTLLIVSIAAPDVRKSAIALFNKQEGNKTAFLLLVSLVVFYLLVPEKILTGVKSLYIGAAIGGGLLIILALCLLNNKTGKRIAWFSMLAMGSFLVFFWYQGVKEVKVQDRQADYALREIERLEKLTPKPLDAEKKLNRVKELLRDRKIPDAVSELSEARRYIETFSQEKKLIKDLRAIILMSNKIDVMANNPNYVKLADVSPNQTLEVMALVNPDDPPRVNALGYGEMLPVTSIYGYTDRQLGAYITVVCEQFTPVTLTTFASGEPRMWRPRLGELVFKFVSAGKSYDLPASYVRDRLVGRWRFYPDKNLFQFGDPQAPFSLWAVIADTDEERAYEYNEGGVRLGYTLK